MSILYKLIIVDDEPIIRNGIAKSIPWEKIGFEVVGLCSNGEEALREVETKRPNVVISDIRMPKMNGTELMKILNERYPQVKIVILSGYSDFDYLNISIKSKVTEYLLKPTDPEEIQQVFTKLKTELDIEKEKNKEITLWKTEYESNKERYFKDWLDTCIKGYSDDAYYEDEFFEKDFLPVENIENSYIYVLVPDGRLGDEPKDLYNLNSKIIKACNQIKKDFCQFAFCLSYEDSIVGIVEPVKKYDEEKTEGELIGFAKQIQTRIATEQGITVSVGISNACKNLHNISTSYTEAKSCAMQNVFLGKENIFLYNQLENSLHLPQVNLKIELIVNSVINNEYAVYTGELERVLNLFVGRPVKEYGYVDTLCVATMQNVAQASLQHSVWPEQIMHSLGVTYTDISRCGSIEEKLSFIIVVLFAFDKAIAGARGQESKAATSANGIKHIIDKEYALNSMSLEYVAKKMNLSPAYVSRTFKNIYHINFSEYLTGLRMKKAKRLLKETTQKIYEISENVGYADSSSFIKLFKKQFGISPNDYRSKAHEERYEKEEGI